MISREDRKWYEETYYDDDESAGECQGTKSAQGRMRVASSDRSNTNGL